MLRHYESSTGLSPVHRDDWSIIAALVLTLTVGFIIGYWSAMVRYEMPYCPQEDSCHADYSGGEWHIIPTQD